MAPAERSEVTVRLDPRPHFDLPDLDRTDRRILAILQEQGRIQNADLAPKVALSAAPCLRRLRRNELKGPRVNRFSAATASGCRPNSARSPRAPPQSTGCCR